MATAAQWLAGARPRTLPAALAPVAVGTGAAAYEDGFRARCALLALVVAVALQAGVNYANDYSDGIRGTDDRRVGPVRLVGQGLARPRAVRLAAFVALGVGAVAGIVLVAISGQWWLLAVGAAALVASWLYSGGPHPYGYTGLGEVFVFVFFGVVAVAGTSVTQVGRITSVALAAAVPVGFWACAILMVNNLRDIPTDAVTGKRTLAVRLGDARSRWLFAGTVSAGFVVVLAMIPYTWWVLLAMAGAAAAFPPVTKVMSGAAGEALVPALASTGLVLLVGGLGLAAGLALGH